MRIAFFGHDAGHAQVVRRIRAMRELGHDVRGLTMRREDDRPRDWPNTDLGRTQDSKFLQRLATIRPAAKRAASVLRDAPPDLVWARNLDMLGIARLAMGRAGIDAPLVYETLDIHRSLTGNSPLSRTMRRIEGRLLRKVDRIVVSSPGFVREYYDRAHPDHPPTALLKNTLLPGEAGKRPSAVAPTDTPIVLGWVGNLRCRGTLSLLEGIARRFEGRVRILAWGRPSLAAIPDFHARIAACPHFDWAGAYEAPRDLPTVYGSLDVVWAGVSFQAEGNARWLIPSRFYEAGFFGVPVLTFAGTETARQITAAGSGVVLDGDTEPALTGLLDGWLKDTSGLDELKRAVLALPDDQFVRDASPLAGLLEELGP